VFTPVQTYGGDGSSGDNNVTVAVSSATQSADGKHVHLKLASLLTRRMYAITVNNVTAASGTQGPYTNVGYYTLNYVSPDAEYNPPTRLVGPVGDFAHAIHASIHRGRVAFDVPFAGPWKVELRRLDGSRVARAEGTGAGRFESASLAPGLYLVAGRAAGSAFSEKVQVR